MNQNDCSGKTLKLWPVFVDHYSVFGSQEQGVSVCLAAKGDMEIVMSWPKVVATVGAIMVVVVIIAPPICKG